MGWLIGLGIPLLVLILPVGVQAIYHNQGVLIRLLIGPLKMTLFPSKKRKQNDQEHERPPVETKVSGNQADKSGGSIREFFPLVHTAFDFLGALRRKLRLDHLQLKLILAGSDPCDLAVNYGRAWTAVGNLMPQLDRLFVIKDRDVNVECDFTAEQTLVFVRLDITITVGRALWLVVHYGIRVLREYMKIKNQRKGGIKR